MNHFTMTVIQLWIKVLPSWDTIPQSLGLLALNLSDPSCIAQAQLFTDRQSV